MKLICLFVICLFVIFAPSAQAASFDLGVFPPIVKIEALPPTDIKTLISIDNASDQTTSLNISFKPFKASAEENGEVQYYLNNEYPDLADPMIFQRMEILDGETPIENLVLAPGQAKTLTLHIVLPKDEPLTDYYFSIIFSSNLNEQNASSVSNIGGIAANVLLSIGKQEKAQGFLEEFSAPFFVEKGPMPFTVRVMNEGKHVITPEGEILIKNVFNQTIGRVDLLPVNILSNTVRALPDSLQNPEATPSANTKYEIRDTRYIHAYWGEKFLLGPYTANLTLKLSDEGPVIRKTIYFFAMPIQGIIGILIAILILILLVSRVKKNLKQ